MIILGDVHGDLDFCRQFANGNKNETIVQLGDLCVGNEDSKVGIPVEGQRIVLSQFCPPRVVESLPKNFHFFPGNHDNRTESVKLKNCLGHFGDFQNIFFVSGAHSYDSGHRLIGKNWWPDEELDYKQSDECLRQWEKSESQILISHDAPQSFVEGFYLIYDPTSTRRLLQSMIELRRPKLVVTGHHHKSLDVNVDGIRWRSLGIAESFEIQDM